MKLETQQVPAWADLAWAARFTEGNEAVIVLHGPKVEIGREWIVEAVWAGDFEPGDFDRTDLVFGTGLRVRPDGVHAVGAATGVDRLWFCQQGRDWFASNSLPCLLAAAGFELLEDHDRYVVSMASVETKGIFSYVQTIPGRPAEIHVSYYQDLLWDGRSLQRRPKCRIPRTYGGFADYEAFLTETAAALGRNLSSPARIHAVTPLATVSRGYDSPAVCVVARHAGCREAATIVNASTILPRSDDGSAVAERLGMACRRYRHVQSAYQHEETLWAATGLGGGLNLTLLEYPRPLCLLFTGSYGDSVWGIRPRDLSDPHGDIDAMICEFRLFAGVFHTVVPWWGILDAGQVNAMGATEEMRPWSVGGRYDRPVARRLVEQAGVPREMFGRRKLMTASHRPFRWPYTKACREDLRQYLRARKLYAPPDWLITLLRPIAQGEWLVYSDVIRPITGPKPRGPWQPWPSLAGSRMLFQWANGMLADRYRAGLEQAASARADAMPARTAKR